ncbi:cellulase family glycosylhydrolase [Actinoplanes derwentensis]|uniref:Endoglucanase n=1 Tax=Actinoplanes derwentensis TaxID=113562 RepID=A0A1H1ZXS2_9ACTN|nr:cellulase family glycosylhydrolase [Actinoplanes derwentensis]GID83489.1 endoglucanase [Actinoplanes derwentensis]SDT38399.1 endoglucanase [Actinoplanes derwentensis]
MRRTRSLVLSLVAAVVAAGLTLHAVSPASAAATTASFAEVSDWGSGWQGEYTITNGGTSALTWRVEFDLPSGTGLASYWDALLTSSGQHHTFTGRSWNASVAPGASVTFGFVGTGSGGPAGCKLNGVSCTGTTTPTTAPTTTTPPSGVTPVARNGQLKVCGRQLCNAQGKAIQLRGMSTHGLQWYSNCVNDASLNVLANEWNAAVLRISMYIQEGGYETDPAGFTAKVNDYIEKATARGLYAIVDWHMLSPGDPNFNLARAKTFFQQIAARHKDKTNILYEIANEPSDVHWASIKSYADQLIPVIRAQDPDGVVLVGTEDWSSLGASGDGQGVSRILANPVNAANIMYTFHFYAASHDDYYLTTFRDAIAKLPMFVTEFGTQQATGDGGNDFARAQQYLDLMAQSKVSWVNWNYSDDMRSGAVFTEGTCAAGAYAGTARLKPAGVWIRDRIRTPDDF